MTGQPQNNQASNNDHQNPAEENGPDLERVRWVLVQHWATQVAEQQQQIGQYQRQLTEVEARATRLYNDASTIHGLYNEALDDLAASETLSVALGRLILRMITENQGLARASYREEYLAAINAYSERNPIDLTADEELDEDL